MNATSLVERRALLRQILQAGLDAVAPDQALHAHVRRVGETLHVDGRTYALEGRRVVVLGAGKGAAPMAAALETILGSRIRQGLVVVKYEHGTPLRHIRLEEAAHPTPDASGERATRAMLELAGSVGKDDLVICLFTGGASALTPAPVPGVTLADLQDCTERLLQCGATIHEINTVRKHLSLWSGGQLARLLAPAEVCTLLVSDVIGDTLSVIASGPTVPDESTFADCRAIIERFRLGNRLSPAVLRHLDEGCTGRLPETPKPGDPVFCNVHHVLTATNAQALHAAALKAEALGFAPCILTDGMCGEAADRARELAEQAQTLAATLAPGEAPLCLLAGGETTVTIRGTGLGGRNQEMALAAALALEHEPCVSALFAGTDGTDGPTEAAGGYADAACVAALRRAGADPLALLHANDSHAALQLADALLVTGPTRTNVMDMALLLVNSREGR